METRKKLRNEITYLVTMLEKTETKQQQLEEFFKFAKSIMDITYND